MRQGSGTDILGANHPLSASIGIIYVSPDDDRKNVLAAILMQEKLVRTQIAVVLPNPNKAFQRPGDFDDLKTMCSNLQAQIIFIIPSGPGPAEFAQRRFTVYPSLEDYADVLQEGEEQPTPNDPAAGGALAGAAALAAYQQPAGGDIDDEDALPPIRTPAPSPEPTGINGGKSPNGKKEGPAAIDLPVNRPKITTKLPTTEPPKNVTPMRNISQRTSGRTPAIAAVPAGGNVASRGLGAVPFPGRRLGGMGVGGGVRRPPRNVLIAIGLVLLVLLLVLCSVAYAIPGALGPLRGLTSFLPHVPSGASVTITPANPLVSNSYVIEAVTGTPNTDQHQVSARLLSATESSQPKTVNATKHVDIPPIQATGTLTFKNGDFTKEQTVPAGTIFKDANGVQVANDVAAVIPAANTNAFGQATVDAHAVVADPAGDIGAGAINGPCCGSSSILVVNSAFTGGQKEEHYKRVQQSDIDNVANPLKDPLLKQVQQTLNGQIRPGEQLLPSTQPRCEQPVTSDHNAGDRADNVTVSVSVKCTGEVYDQKGTQSLLQNLLQQRAESTFGQGYALVGGKIDMQTTVQHINNGNVSLLVKAQGVYQMSDALQQQLKKQIAGKSVTEAKTLLKGQKGIADVTIQANGSTLPTDPGQITIVLQHVTGLPGLGRS